MDVKFGKFIRKGIKKNTELYNVLVNKNDANDLYPYTNKKVLMKCQRCGREDYYDVGHVSTRGFSCKFCSDGISYPEKFMRSILSQLGQEYITQYSPDWAENRFYDFYIPSKSLIIETDGGFHGKNHFDHTVEETLAIDKLKDKMAIEHNLIVLRIDCQYKNIEDRYSYIKTSIMNSDIWELLNIDKNLVDFDECNKFALSSLVYNVCTDWDGTIDSYKDICKKYHISKDSLVRYLKLGTEIGLCSYNKFDILQQRNNNTKPVKVLKNGFVVAQYKSIKQCIESSVQDFGVCFTREGIRQTCSHRQKHHHGYVIEYVDTDNNTKLLKEGD